MFSMRLIDFSGSLLDATLRKNLDANQQYGGLKWVEIQLHEGAFVATVIEPETTQLKKSIVFIGRSKEDFMGLDTDPFAAENIHDV